MSVAATTTLRDSLRATIFSAKRSSQMVPIGIFVEGVEQQVVEVIQPKVGDMLDNMGTDNMRQRIARMMIDSCFVPGTSEKVFEEADYDGLMELPAGGDYAALIAAITANIDPKKQEAAAKK